MPTGRWVKVLQAVFVVLVVVAFARVFSKNAEDFRDLDIELRPSRLLLALPLSLAAGPLLPIAWRSVLRAAGHTLTPAQAVRTWYLGQTARYLPTGLVAFASRALLLAKHDVPRRVTMATVAVELGLIVGVGGGLAAACLPSSELALGLRLLIGAGCLVGLAAGPWLLRWASGRVGFLDPHRHGGWGVRDMYAAEGLFVVNAVAKSLAFVVFAGAVQPVQWGDVFLLIGALNAATTLGTVGITPAGLGVREGAMAAILVDRYGLGDGAALAVAARVWDTVIEVLWLLLVQRRGFKLARAGQEGVDRGA